MEFVKLTEEGGGRVAVNLDRVKWFRPANQKGHCVLFFDSPDEPSIVVRESCEDLENHVKAKALKTVEQSKALGDAMGKAFGKRAPTTRRGGGYLDSD